MSKIISRFLVGHESRVLKFIFIFELELGTLGLLNQSQVIGGKFPLLGIK